MPRSSREKSAETRSHIIDAAFQLFVENGYNATPMRAISQKAGVTVGAVYNHFETKEDIWVSVLHEKHPYHEILPLMLSAEGETLAEVMRSAARSMVAELINRPYLFHMMFIEIVEFKSVHVPDLYKEIVPNLGGLQTLLAGKKGRLRDIPIPIVLRSFVGLFFSYYITGILLKEMQEVPTDEVSLDQFVDLYLNGVLTDDDPMREKLT
jgi:AcrR family transcriptional regulator